MGRSEEAWPTASVTISPTASLPGEKSIYPSIASPRRTGGPHDLKCEGGVVRCGGGVGDDHEWNHNRHLHCAPENICILRRRIASHRFASPRASERARDAVHKSPISLFLPRPHVTLPSLLRPDDEKCIKSFRTIRTRRTARRRKRRTGEGGCGRGRGRGGTVLVREVPRLAAYLPFSLLSPFPC